MQTLAAVADSHSRSEQARLHEIWLATVTIDRESESNTRKPLYGSESLADPRSCLMHIVPNTVLERTRARKSYRNTTGCQTEPKCARVQS